MSKKKVFYAKRKPRNVKKSVNILGKSLKPRRTKAGAYGGSIF